MCCIKLDVVLSYALYLCVIFKQCVMLHYVLATIVFVYFGNVPFSFPVYCMLCMEKHVVLSSILPKMCI